MFFDRRIFWVFYFNYPWGSYIYNKNSTVEILNDILFCYKLEILDDILFCCKCNYLRIFKNSEYSSIEEEHTTNFGIKLKSKYTE